MRRLKAAAEPHRPVYPFDRAEPLSSGQIVPVDLELLLSAPFFRRGESLHLDIRGRWSLPKNPFLGTFPAHYQPSPAAGVVLHMGDEHDAHLLVPRTRQQFLR
jgi:hypothetical protein